MSIQKAKAAYVIACFDPEIRKLETILDERFGGRENYFYQEHFHTTELAKARMFLKKCFAGMEIESHYFSKEEQILIF